MSFGCSSEQRSPGNSCCFQPAARVCSCTPAEGTNGTIFVYAECNSCQYRSKRKCRTYIQPGEPHLSQQSQSEADPYPGAKRCRTHPYARAAAAFTSPYCCGQLPSQRSTRLALKRGDRISYQLGQHACGADCSLQTRSCSVNVGRKQSDGNPHGKAI